MGRRETMTMMAEIEDDLAKLLAERALLLADEKEKRFLRGVWHFARVRAGYFSEMAQNERD